MIDQETLRKLGETKLDGMAQIQSSSSSLTGDFAEAAPGWGPQRSSIIGLISSSE